jgi:hypothetical protein
MPVLAAPSRPQHTGSVACLRAVYTPTAIADRSRGGDSGGAVRASVSVIAIVLIGMIAMTAIAKPPAWASLRPRWKRYDIVCLATTPAGAASRPSALTRARPTDNRTQSISADNHDQAAYSGCAPMNASILSRAVVRTFSRALASTSNGTSRFRICSSLPSRTLTA